MACQIHSVISVYNYRFPQETLTNSDFTYEIHHNKKEIFGLDKFLGTILSHYNMIMSF